jgi:competence ComEA-like helix-hairpin-helix protein
MPNPRWKAISKAFAKAQNLTGTTRGEFIFVTVLLAGLLVGLLTKQVSIHLAGNTQSNISRSELAHVIDSLSAVEASTFTGSTPDAEPVLELAKGDTLRKKPFTARAEAKKEKITSGKININTATVQDLMRLPGVGEATAEKIIAERTERRFTRIEDVMRVKGIGKKKFEAMKPFLDM